MKNFKITPLKGQPAVVDEVTADKIESIHIERMNKHLYYVRIGDEVFHFRTAAKRGPGIILEGPK